MAIGISLMFGIFLPLNFNSPYKATSIVDFWRRWHMTLSQFLRDYLYIPLGGNRHGRVAALRQSDDHDAARRALARRGLDFRGLGRAAWRLSLHQSRLEQFRAEGRAALRAGRRCRGVRADLSCRRRRLGVLPRRQHGDRRSTCCRRWPIPPISPLAATKSPMRAVRRSPMPRWRGSRRTRRRSWATTTRTGRSAKISARGGCGRCSSTPARRCWRSGFSEFQQHSEFIYFRF